VSEQPEALRLADWLCRIYSDLQTPRRAAAELRRLHAVNAELLEALKFALENGCQTVYAHESDEIGNKGCCDELSYHLHSPDCWTIKARAAIAKAEEVKP
jgi:hypothetical protein